MPGHAQLAFWQPKRSDATRACVLAGALELRLGAAVRRRAACGANSCPRRHWLPGARLQQRLLASE